MGIKSLKYTVLRSLGNLLLGGAVELLCRSLKTEIVNDEAVRSLSDKNKHYVLAFWHGTMLLPWYQHKGKGLKALTSQSKDGELLARVLHKWGYQVVRGSSSRGGKVALGILVDLLKFEGPIAITPDGPRGPEYEFKPGAVIAAQRSNVPLVLLGVAYENKRQLRSWDKFQIPKAFSRVKLIYSDPIIIPENADRARVAEIIQECGNKLNALQSQAGQFS